MGGGRRAFRWPQAELKAVPAKRAFDSRELEPIPEQSPSFAEFAGKVTIQRPHHDF